ncbi:MAG: 3D domain-containing protein [bacterium]|nr:3D domain-containing protein [bacterium]
MIFRKGFLFAVAMIVILSNMNTAQAAETKVELPLPSFYDFKNDPFLLDWTFLVEDKQAPVAVPAPISFEEKTLNRWKEKQAHLWAALPKEKFVINASAYTAAADECGKSDGITASGLKVEEQQTLACPPAFPFGTRISIEGVGERRCEDRGGAIKGNHFDIYVETKKEAFAFGRRNLVAEVIE